jgi:hypothetical protein
MAMAGSMPANCWRRPAAEPGAQAGVRSRPASRRLARVASTRSGSGVSR